MNRNLIVSLSQSKTALNYDLSFDVSSVAFYDKPPRELEHS